VSPFFDFLAAVVLTIPLLANGEISLLSNKVTREQFSSLALDVVDAEGPTRIRERSRD